ncbi:MFS transporter [Cupriavidus plantarum]|uniref:MFS transporter n=1 Tax=Cupriavidus plantarum TaxID=942865 RepID=UPI00339D92EE
MDISAARQPYRAAAAAFFGTMIEWYDFFIYATASALVFGDVFFSNADHFVGTLASLGTFAVGFVARPVGAIVFGHLGDKVGRKRSLIVTLLLMGIATMVIGMLPSYQSIGVMAPILLVVLRLLQGVAVGGEWGGAVLIAAEHAPPKLRTFLAAAPQYGSPVGLVIATSMFAAVSSLPDADFKSWGWRIPFLFSGVLVLAALLIRRSVNESPELEAHRARMAKARHVQEVAPLRNIFARYKTRLLLGMALSMLGISGFYFITTLMITFTTTYLHVARPDILRVGTYTGIVELLSFPIASYIATRIGERRTIAIVAGAAVLWAAPMMMLVMTGNIANIAVGILVATVFIGAYYAVLAPFLPKAFPIDVRYTGISLSFQLCGALFGGTTPLLGLWIAERFGLHWGPLALLFAIIAGATFLGAVLIPHEPQAEGGAESEGNLSASGAPSGMTVRNA